MNEILGVENILLKIVRVSIFFSIFVQLLIKSHYHGTYCNTVVYG